MSSHLRKHRLTKHHLRIAEVIASHESERDRFALASLFSSAFRKDDHRFNIDAFMDASGVEGWWTAW